MSPCPVNYGKRSRGHTGDFSNTIFSGHPLAPANGTVTSFLENDQVLADIDDHFLGTAKVAGSTVNVGYLDEEMVMAVARAAGVLTVAPGRGANGVSGNNVTPGTPIPNNVQHDYCVQVITDAAIRGGDQLLRRSRVPGAYGRTEVARTPGDRVPRGSGRIFLLCQPLVSQDGGCCHPKF